MQPTFSTRPDDAVDPSPAGFRSVHIYDFNRSDPHAWLPWVDLTDPVREHPWIPRDAIFIGKTLTSLAQMLGRSRASSLRVLVTWFWGTDPILPFSGDDVIVFCLGDELGRKPAYAHDVKVVAKTGGWTRRPFVTFARIADLGPVAPAALQELHAQLIRLPSALSSAIRTMRRGRRARYVEIPLAPWSFPSARPRPMDSRRYDISFAGSMTNEGHGRGWILSQKTRSRRKLLQRLERLKRDRHDVQVEIRTFDSFHDAKHVEGYGDLLMDTKLAPCPRGGFRETYRLFEAAASGCIPITETLPRRRYYEGCPAVQLRSWSELIPVVNRLLADPDALRRRQWDTIEWWRATCSPEATATVVADAIRKADRAPVR